MHVTFLGPAGATFTAIAYDRLATLFGTPGAYDTTTVLSLAKTNEEVLGLILKHRGYGAIAMETKAEGRVDPPINSFIELLKQFDGNCPTHIIGGISMRIRFALMGRPGATLKDIKRITAHPKSLGACRRNIEKIGAEKIEAPSNGKAAEMVAASGTLADAALGPIEAAGKYNLRILDEAFEDAEAITTFYLLGPQSHQHSHLLSATQRMLMVFRVAHEPNSLVKVLIPFGEERINLRLVHSLYMEEWAYDFAIETECDPARLPYLRIALAAAECYTKRRIVFGPFPVISA